jgi:hypothetical protein
MASLGAHTDIRQGTGVRPQGRGERSAVWNVGMADAHGPEIRPGPDGTAPRSPAEEAGKIELTPFEGHHLRTKPYRYWLAEQEKKWPATTWLDERIRESIEAVEREFTFQPTGSVQLPIE